MTTRNQKKKQSANQKPSSSNGVDFHKEPIVALPAPNPQSEMHKEADSTSDYVNKQAALPSTPSSSMAATQKPSSSSMAATQKGNPVSTPRRTSSNPVVRDIDALKSGTLKIVSPAVSKYFGFPAGPVSNLDFSDPKVAEFFNDPLYQSKEKLDSVSGVSGSVLGSGIASTQTPVLSQNVIVPASASPTGVLQQGSLPQPTAAAAGGTEMGPGGTARPSKAAGNHSTSNTTAPASWAGLFKGNRVLTDDSKLSLNYNGVTSEKVILDDEDLEDDGEEKKSLIGFFNGKFPGIKAIQHIVDGWSRKCSFHRHNSGWLVFTFDEEDDCDIVLKEGPYYAFNKPLVLKKMPEFFDFSDEAYSTAPVWIQLPNLPLRAWKKSALEKICSFLGTPLQLDQVTKEKERKSFARCLVEIDVSKDLPSIVCCDLPRGKSLRQHVLYEDTPTFCSNCKKLGHESEDCYANNNGVPSLYVARNKKDKEKIKNGAAGARQNVQAGSKGSAKARPSGQAQGKDLGPDAAVLEPDRSRPDSGQLQGKNTAAAALSAANKDIGTAGIDDMAAGNQGFGKDSRHSIPPSTTTALNNKKGNTAATLKDPGMVSANSFGPLANGTVDNWSDEVEASNARNNNNNNNKNGKKK